MCVCMRVIIYVNYEKLVLDSFDLKKRFQNSH